LVVQTGRPEQTGAKRAEKDFKPSGKVVNILIKINQPLYPDPSKRAGLLFK
jgi:hypothetical protein